MRYRELGSTGTKVSELCFGTWRFALESDGVVETDREEAHDLLDEFTEAGGNFIDTANVYGDPSGTSERWIGEWLDERDREEFVLASKVRGGFRDGPNGSGLSRPHIRRQIEGTLDRLGTEYIDVYYIHGWDSKTPIAETLRTMDRLVQEGKVHYLAASNLAGWQLMKALWTSDVEGLEQFEVIQPKFNAAFREQPASLLDVCGDQDLAVCPYSPLEGGFLTGKYERDGSSPEGSRGDLNSWGDRFDERQWRVLEALREVADDLDATPTQVALRWLIDRPRFTCVPIIGARTTDQMSENMAAADIELPERERKRITDAYEDEES